MSREQDVVQKLVDAFGRDSLRDDETGIEVEPPLEFMTVRQVTLVFALLGGTALLVGGILLGLAYAVKVLFF